MDHSSFRASSFGRRRQHTESTGTLADGRAHDRSNGGHQSVAGEARGCQSCRQTKHHRSFHCSGVLGMREGQNNGEHLVSLGWSEMRAKSSAQSQRTRRPKEVESALQQALNSCSIHFLLVARALGWQQSMALRVFSWHSS